MIKAVVFDIDGTLAPGASWLDLTRDLGGSVEAHQQIFTDYQAKIIDYPESKRRLLGLWQATGHANRGFMEQIFQDWPLRQAAPATMQKARELGLRPCLITGSIDLYAQSLAGRLQVPDWYANTPLVFNAAGELTDYHYVLDQSSEKLRQFELFRAKYGLNPAECLAVGDGDNDLGLFQTTGQGVLLASEGQSPELRAAAWKTIPELEGLIPIIEDLRKHS